MTCGDGGVLPVVGLPGGVLPEVCGPSRGAARAWAARSPRGGSPSFHAPRPRPGVLHGAAIRPALAWRSTAWSW